MKTTQLAATQFVSLNELLVVWRSNQRVSGCQGMQHEWDKWRSSKRVFLNRRAAARYRALASIIPGRDRTEETTICYKISLVQLIT